MSLRAILWALNDAPVDDPTDALILVALADNARDNGCASWPSVPDIARRARCSDRTVQRRIPELIKRGIVRLGDQKLVAHLDRRYRPTVYDLVLTKVRERRGDTTSPLPASGDTGGSPAVTAGQSSGDTGVNPAVTRVSPKPSYEPNHEPSVEPAPPYGDAPQLSLIPGGNEPPPPSPAAVAPDRHADADAVAASWWESFTPRPSGNFVGFRTIIRSVIAAGWHPDDVAAATRRCGRTFNRAAIERELERGTATRGVSYRDADRNQPGRVMSAAEWKAEGQ